MSEHALNDPTERVEATTTPEGAKGWADQAGSAQVLAGGHGLNVAPDASPNGVRAETRREDDGAGGEPSNAPVADPEVQTCLDDLARYRGLLAREKVESTRSNLLSAIRGMERWLENARRSR